MSQGYSRYSELARDESADVGRIHVGEYRYSEVHGAYVVPVTLCDLYYPEEVTIWYRADGLELWRNYAPAPRRAIESASKCAQHKTAGARD